MHFYFDILVLKWTNKTKTATYMINELMNLITFDFICLSTLTNTDKLVLVYFLHV